MKELKYLFVNQADNEDSFTAFILMYNCNELVYLLAWQLETVQAIYVFCICIEWATVIWTDFFVCFLHSCEAWFP